MKMTDILKKYVLPNLPYLIFLWFFAKVGEAVRLASGVDASTKLLGLADGFMKSRYRQRKRSLLFTKSRLMSARSRLKSAKIWKKTNRNF